MSVLSFKHHWFFPPEASLNTTTSHTCSLECETDKSRNTLTDQHARTHANTALQNLACHPLYLQKSLASHVWFVLLIGIGWPINAPVLDWDHWLSAWWLSVKCTINLGCSPHHIRVAQRPGRVHFSWQHGKTRFSRSGSLISFFTLWEKLYAQIVSSCFYVNHNFTKILHIWTSLCFLPTRALPASSSVSKSCERWALDPWIWSQSVPKQSLTRKI